MGGNTGESLLTSMAAYRQIYRRIQQIPPGRVATYGQIASLLDNIHARMVGYALSALEYDSAVPWHRIVNRHGRISPRSYGEGDYLQRQLLESEGVSFENDDTIDLRKFQWLGPEISPFEFNEDGRKLR